MVHSIAIFAAAAMATAPQRNGTRAVVRKASSKCAAPQWFCAQFGEDVYVRNTFFPHKRNGTFFEMGGYDGIHASNTMHFERTLGWRGLLIEGCPTTYEKLVKNRPLAHTVNMVASDVEHDVEFQGCSLTSGITENFSADFAEKFHSKALKGNHREARKIRVRAKPLGPVLASLGYYHIDFFVLDVEGAEMKVLNSFDLSKLSISVAMVEADGRDEAKDEAVRAHFKRHGYLHHKMGRNDFFYSSKMARRLDPPLGSSSSNLQLQFPWE